MDLEVFSSLNDLLILNNSLFTQFQTCAHLLISAPCSAQDRAGQRYRRCSLIFWVCRGILELPVTFAHRVGQEPEDENSVL